MDKAIWTNKLSQYFKSSVCFLILLISILFNRTDYIQAAVIANPATIYPSITPSVSPILSVFEDNLEKTKKVATEEPFIDLPILKKIDAGSGDLSSYEQLFTMAYSSLVNCFGVKSNAPECTDSKSGDINNDGIITEVDYNLILIGFHKINKQKILKNLVSPTGHPLLDSTGVSESALVPSIIPTQTVVNKEQQLLVKGIRITKIAAGGSILSIAAAAGVTAYMSYQSFKTRHKKP